MHTGSSLSVSARTSDFFGRPIPDHVPRELLREINYFDGPGMERDPFGTLRQLQSGPAIVYNLHNPIHGQSWLPTRAREIKHVLANPEIFSSQDQAGFSALVGEKWRLGCVEMDAPQHMHFRKLMNPWFAPNAVAKLDTRVRARAAELIDAVVADGGCDFIEAFGNQFPNSIFMELFGLPHSDAPMLLDWEFKLLKNPDPAVKSEAAHHILGYLKALAEERRREPRDDLVTLTVQAKFDGEPLSYDDVIGIFFVLFTGGLDTVASSLGFHFKHLAMHPEYQAHLRAHPEDIPRAVEEYLRAYSPVTSQRRALQDVELAGAAIRRGDWVTLIDALASLDPEENPDPERVTLDRKSVRHYAFEAGMHVCLGAHLARRELKIAIEEWLTRVPPFRLADGEVPTTHGGIIFGVNHLRLQW
jgi:cytochrome P450